MNKIAVIVDSGCDIPAKLASEKGMYIIPLRINYSDGEYRDGFDITPDEVYESLKREIPKTSLPSGDDIMELFDTIRKDGFTDVICITISSNLSGTNNIFRVISEDITDLNIRIVDSKNIAIASGFLGLLAQDLVNQGLTLDEIYEKVESEVKNSHVYFCVDTLEYLRKGGRIGLVASFLATKLNLKPVITCNDEGIYYTAAKVKGKKQAIRKLIELAKEQIQDGKSFNLCMSNGGAGAEFQQFKTMVLESIPNAHTVYETDISPTLGVHTGPGLLGLGIQIIEK